MSMRHVIIAVVGAILGSAFFQYVNHAHGEVWETYKKQTKQKDI